MLRYLIMGGSSKQRKSNSKQTSVHSSPKKVTDAEASASGLARRQRLVLFTLQSHSSLWPLPEYDWRRRWSSSGRATRYDHLHMCEGQAALPSHQKGVHRRVAEVRLECPLVLNLNPRLEAMSTMTLTSLITAVKSAMATRARKIVTRWEAKRMDTRCAFPGARHGHARGTPRPCQGHDTAIPGA